MALLILIPSHDEDAFVETLNVVAPYDWVDRRQIKIFPVPEDSVSSSETAMAVCRYCQNNNITHVLIPDRLRFKERLLSTAGYMIHRGPSVKALVNGNGLRDELRSRKLDWRSELTTRLDRYWVGMVSEARVDKWLSQFERLGSHRAIGEHLLQLTDVLSLTDLGESLSTDSDFYGSDLVVGFNNDKWGKSWATVSNLIRKKCPSATLLPIGEAIMKGAHPKVLRLVEDGLFSGTEIRGILDSLRGTRRNGRSPKVPQLLDPSVLSKVSAHLHFSVICDFGLAVLREYLASNQLLSIQVAVSSSARKMRVLQGEETQYGGHEQNPSFRSQLQSRVVPFAFQDDKGWATAVRRDEAQLFCENVGEQLWRHYISKKPNFDSDSWPHDRIRRCGLGMDGLGLTFAFPHSIPRASLPVLWASGNVTFNNRTIDWAPLFPNADT